MKNYAKSDINLNMFNITIETTLCCSCKLYNLSYIA